MARSRSTSSALLANIDGSKSQANSERQATRVVTAMPDRDRTHGPGARRDDLSGGSGNGMCQFGTAFNDIEVPFSTR
jgi:hypothetical protein